MNELYELKESLCDILKEYSKKDMSANNLNTIDTITHTIKNLDKIIETYEEQENGYSGRYYYDGMNTNGMNNRRSYNRGYNNGSYARRDGRGRYSRDGADMASQLRELMEDAPDDRTRQEFQRFIQKIEQM